MKSVNALFFILIPYLTFTQNPFERTYGNPSTIEYAKSIVTVDNAIYSFGTAWNPDSNSEDFFLVKLDEEGNELWTQYYGGALVQQGMAILALEDGLLLVGLSNVSDNYNGLLIKVNFEGEEIWAKDYGGPRDDALRSAAINSNGTLVVAGEFHAEENGIKAWIMEISTNDGTIIQEGLLGEFLRSKAFGIQAANIDNGWIIVGELNDSFATFKIDADLTNVLWELSNPLVPTPYYASHCLDVSAEGLTVSGTFGAEDPYYMVISAQGVLEMEQYMSDLSGGYAIQGIIIEEENQAWFASSSENVNFLLDGANLRKVNLTDGTLIENTFFNDINRIDDIAVYEGQLLLTGFTSKTNGGRDVVNIRLNDDLTINWESQSGIQGEYGHEFGYAIVQDNQGDYYLLERFLKSEGNNDIAVTKINSNGDIIWRTEINQPLDDIGYGMMITSDNNIAILNYQFLSGTEDNVQILKMDLQGTLLWEVTEAYPDTYGFRGNILELSNGHLIAGGATLNNKLFLQTVTANGELVSADTISPPVSANIYQVYDVQLAKGEDNILVCGRLNQDAYILKYTPTGELIWDTQLDLGPLSRIYDLAVAENGEIFGYGLSYIEAAGNFHGLLYHLSAQGDSIDTHIIPPISDEYYVLGPYTAAFDDSNHLLLIDDQFPEFQPTSFLSDESVKARALLVDKEGNTIWEQTFDKGVRPVFIEGIPNNNDGYALIGFTRTDNLNDVYLVVTDADGMVQTNTPIYPGLRWDVFPNPASEQIQFKINIPYQKELQVDLYNLQGQQLWSGIVITNQFQHLDIKHLAPGVYLFSVMFDGTRYALQWVKE